MRGTKAESAAQIISHAKALEAQGCFAVVLECVPDVVAQEITKRLKIPTIGIGSGPYCDGQVVVTYDVVGLFERFKPKFIKRYASVAGTIRDAAAAYVQDVRSGAYPGAEQTTGMSPEERLKLKDVLND
jgi:3-methyl-2-oxobutanoate hydroxymethyltransferase